jgi:hypothetical protein
MLPLNVTHTPGTILQHSKAPRNTSTTKLTRQQNFAYCGSLSHAFLFEPALSGVEEKCTNGDDDGNEEELLAQGQAICGACSRNRRGQPLNLSLGARSL